MALGIQPEDTTEIVVEEGDMDPEHEQFRHDINVGLEQLERGEYRTYMRGTLHELVDEVKAEGRKRSIRTSEHEAYSRALARTISDYTRCITGEEDGYLHN